MKTFSEWKQLKEDTAPVVSVGGGAMSQEPVVTKKVQKKLIRRATKPGAPENDSSSSSE